MAEARHGIVVRNTFIDVRQPEEAGNHNDGSSSPHRRNLSAPPSPARVARGRRDQTWGEDGDEKDGAEEDQGSIPNYHWGPEHTLWAQDAGAAADYLHIPGGTAWGPDQYIEDCPPAHKFGQHDAQFGGVPGVNPPGLLLSSPDGKGGRKGRGQAPGGFKG